MIAAVLGGAKGGIDELVEISRKTPVRLLFAIDDIAAEYPGRVDYFVTLHPEKLPQWLERRRSLGLSEPGAVVAHDKREHVTEVVDYHWLGTEGSGSSGLYAAKVALERTNLPVVLCGVPMNSDLPTSLSRTIYLLTPPSGE